MSDKVTTKTMAAHTMGWLRRPELDTPSSEAWELPDGKLYAARRGYGEPIVVKMNTPWLDRLRALDRLKALNNDQSN